MTLTYKELEIELELEGLLAVEEFRLTQGLNQHALLTLKLLIEEEQGDDLVNMASALQVAVRELEETKGQFIFQGKLETVSAKKENGLVYLYLEAYSYTMDWDRAKKSRSFQNGSMTYMEAAERLLSVYGKADIQDEVTKGAKIPEFLLQYEESDWVFLRRLASHFGSFLLPDASDACGKVYFGIPKISSGTVLEKKDYTLEKDFLYHARVLEREGVLPQEVSCWKVKTRRFLRMWETLIFNGIEAIVTGMELHTNRGELVYSYELSRRAGIRREKEQNPRIYGMSIPATVMERSGNRVRVHLEVDPVYEASEHTKYFTYAIESSSFYCMPEEGSQVHIYFPDHDEQSAVAVHALRSGTGSAGACTTPDNKRFSDPSGSAMDMTPSTLQFAPDAGGTTVLHLESGGFLSVKGMDITLKTQMGMMSGKNKPVKELMICGEKKLVMQIGEGAEDCITMESGIDAESALITQDADSSPKASPSGDELLSEQEATDVTMRTEENEAVKNDMVTKKRESKQKVLDGVISLVTVVGLTALTVATGGATAPLLIAAGVKGAFAVADIAEGLDGYSKMNALDASQPANFLRDTIFCGNQAAYDIASMISDVVFDVVSGKALAKAFSGAEKLTGFQKTAMKVKQFWDSICPKSKVANFVAQTGGTVLFGAANDYLTTGNFNLKNLGFDTLGGLIKGTLGTAVTEKVKSFLNTDNKWIKKLVGTVGGAVTGTTVDIGINRLTNREIDPIQIFKQNLITSGLGQLFGEPVDVVTGAFLITATDFVMEGIQEEIRTQRRYNSTNTDAGLMGPGWKFTWEGRLYRDGNRLHAALDSGLTALFEWDGEKAANITRGCEWLDLVKEEEGWQIRDRKQHKIHHYNAQGLLMAVEDQNGQCIRLTYDNGRLQRITTPFGYELDVKLREGRLIQLKDSMGRTMQYRYENGFLSDVVHMDLGITHYQYDRRGYLVKAVDQAKVTYLQNQYDDAGRVVLQTLANSDTYEAEYHPESRRVTVRSSIGQKEVHYQYNSKGEILTMAFQDGTRTEYEYDENGHRVRQTDRLNRATCWSYDHLGRVTEEVRPGGGKTVSQYDDADNLICRSDPAGRQTVYEYDSHHNRTLEREESKRAARERRLFYDRSGRITETVDAAGNRTLYQYEDGHGKPSVIRFADGEECTFEYDPAGRLMAQEDLCGRTEYGYNARNKCALVRDGEGNESHWMYDGMGRLLAMYPPRAWKEQKGEYSYSYDFLDRLIDTQNPDGGHERQMLDGEGKVLKKIHPNAYDRYLDDGEGIIYDYDSDGNNIRVHYPDGGCERMFYDAAGNRIRHVMPESYDQEKDDGPGWTYTYDEEDRLTSVTGPDGVLQSAWTYDAAGNPVTETDAEGRTTFRTWTAYGELEELLRPAKEQDGEILYERTTWTYDLTGNLICEQRHGGYWSQESRLLETEGQGLTLCFFYDKRNRRIRAEDGTGAVVCWQYDVQGKPVREERAISEDMRQVFHYSYDRAGHLTEIREELDNGLSAAEGDRKYAVTRYRYDENGNRTEIITPEGYRILREYDACDRLIRERTVDRANGMDRTVSVTYDYAGNIIGITRQGKGLEAWETRYDYDLKDRIIHAKDCLGPVFIYEYDKNDQLKTEILPESDSRTMPGAPQNRNSYCYNAYGSLLTRTDGAGTVQEEYRYLPDGKPVIFRGADGQEIVYTYGIHGQETEIHTARSRKAGKAVQSFCYDSRGRITGIKDGNENRTGYGMDGWGRVQKVQHADGGEEGYTYDFAGNITSTTDANGGVITYRYNSQGLVCEIIDQEGCSETFRYDREGRMVLHTDRNGNRVRTTYNVDGNPVLETGTDAAGKNTITRSWEYDTAGRVRKAAAGGFCYTYEYRADGKLLRKSASGRTLLSCTWFSDGSLESLTDGSGKTIHYRYDWRGKLAAVTDENGQALAEYTHTPGGKLAEILHGNGIRTRYEYDTDGNLVRLHLEKGGGGTISDLYYEYDLNGNRTLKSGSCLLPDGSLAKQEVSYRYDCMDRLTDEVHHGDKTAYVYDSCGNRLKKLDKNGKEEYNYNRKNQLVSRTWDGGYAAYHYDRQGNLLEAAGTEGNTLFAYNVFNRQTAVTMPDGGRLENRYDAEGLRAGTVENSVETRFLYFNGELLSELDEAGDTISRYILGYGATAVWNRGKEGYHPCHLDEQNSTAYITGLDGEIKNSYQYDAFGNLQNRNITVRNRILYTGQQYDEITGQYYLRARFYHPAVGRFLQEDVYRGDGLNLYAYCANNPVVYYDPSGYKLSNTDYLKINYDNAGSGYSYYQNHDHQNAFKNVGPSSYYEGNNFQSHHMLQGQWAKENLKAYGYDYKKAPTISLGTGYYSDRNGNKKVAPHTIANNSQGDRLRARGGDYSSTLNCELIFGATDLVKSGMSEEVVLSELERNYKMLDALNEQNREKILKGDLVKIEYDRETIEQAVREQVEEEKNKNVCKEN